ncbi:MAG: hypothetical protein ACOVMM_01460 [Chitinophagaceae bacterium]
MNQKLNLILLLTITFVTCSQKHEQSNLFDEKVKIVSIFSIIDKINGEIQTFDTTTTELFYKNDFIYGTYLSIGIDVVDHELKSQTLDSNYFVFNKRDTFGYFVNLKKSDPFMKVSVNRIKNQFLNFNYDSILENSVNIDCKEYFNEEKTKCYQYRVPNTTHSQKENIEFSLNYIERDNYFPINLSKKYENANKLSIKKLHFIRSNFVDSNTSLKIKKFESIVYLEKNFPFNEKKLLTLQSLIKKKYNDK